MPIAVLMPFTSGQAAEGRCAAVDLIDYVRECPRQQRGSDGD
jgi:hypothetical protein